MEMAMFMETHRILQGDTEIEYAIKTFVGQEYKHIDEFVWATYEEDVATE